MKKTLFALALMGGLSSASAVEINPDGTGQVLLYPFYTVKDGYISLVSITNTTNKAKSVKVRFSEGKNTWEVLDFNLYLSPYDVWTGALTKVSGGGVRLTSTDTSCTVPTIPSAGVELRNTLYTRSDDNGNGEAEKDQSLARLEEGHLEVIEMGNVLDTEENKFATAIEHVDGVPGDCKSLYDAWEGGVWSTNRNTNMTAPTGGLYGSMQIVDVANGLTTAIDATAVENFWNLKGAGNSAHNRPGTSFPDLNGQVEDGNSIVKLGNLTSSVVANGGQVTSTWDETIDALSSVLMSKQISNNYSVEKGLDASTDWVISFPTKHFYVNGEESRNGLGPNRAPFKSTFENDNDEGACENISLQYYDREERRSVKSTTVDFSPAIAASGPSLCWETSRVTFNNTKVFGDAATLNNIEVPYDAGWATISFSGSMTSKEGHRYVGLPVLGFSTTSVKNGSLNGGATLANYAASVEHKRLRQIVE